MKHMTRALIVCIGIGLLTIAITVTIGSQNRKGDDQGPNTEYQCDVKNFRLSTTIEIDKENEFTLEVKQKT